MGYTTEFNGQFNTDKPIAEHHAAYINKFARTRRVKRSSAKAEKLKDTERKAVELPIGKQGEYFVGGLGDFGQGDDNSIMDGNHPPKSQPGLWCQWIVSEDEANVIEWDGGEKFYYYVEWLEYIIENFLKPWGYVLNGDVEYRGEEWGDTGIISVKDNVVDAD